MPADGKHLGATGIPDISPGIETAEIDSENQTSVLGASISKNTLELTIRLKEWTTEGLAWALCARKVGNGMFGGGSSEIVYEPITIVWKFDNGQFGFFHAYKTYVSSPASLSPQKGEPQELECTLTCVADTTRDDNDPLYQLQNPDGFVDL